MSEGRSHEALVGDQFGSQAGAYLSSAVHARGADLDALAQLVAGAGGARVLDLGCGAGHVSFLAAPHVAEVVAYDLSEQMLAVVTTAATERSIGNIVTRQGVAERLPFPDASFDFVLSRYSAHHWQDADAGLREVARVLRPDGVFGLVDSLSPGAPVLDTFLQALELLRDPSHVRSYARVEWDAALVRAGLQPGPSTAYRVRLEFASWIARMRTPQPHVAAIRSLQAAVSDEVRAYFGIDAQGSFDLDVGFFRAVRRPGGVRP